MAERRMFAKTIIGSDAFLDMPLSTQALYFHLSMRADDDGFINNSRKIQRMVGCSEDDLKLLFVKKFLIPFESGVVVIKHWKIHNYIRNDRYKPTVYTEEKEMLECKDNGAYTIGIPSGNQAVYQMDTQVRVGKESIVKDNIVEYIEDVPQAETPAPKPKRKRFTPPTIEEVQAYCNERKNNVDAQRFIDYYSANGWMVGKNKMKDWKAAVRTWENNGYSTKDTANSKSSSFDTEDFFETALRRSYATVPSSTAGDDPEIKRRADALKERLI